MLGSEEIRGDEKNRKTVDGDFKPYILISESSTFALIFKTSVRHSSLV